MKKLFRIITLLFLILQFSHIFAESGSAIYEISKVYVINIEGVINSIMASYVINNIEKVEREKGCLIILKIDTPGGILDSTRDIVLKIMNSEVPIIGYVGPEGARAASAGAFIMLACDILVMNESSHIGAAHPVNLGQKIDSTMEEKIVNDTVAFIESIAKRNNKNIEVAKLMVKKSISLPSDEALKKNIADFIVKNIDELLNKIEKIKIKKNNRIYKLTKEKKIKFIKMNPVEKFLFSISHPNIAYILLILGIYGILAEFSTPGIGFPGVVGSICLILAFFALNTLPINLAGLLLIALSVALFILELSIQSGGILALGSVTSFTLGSFMLIRSSSQFLKISPYIIISAGIFTLLFFSFVLFYGLKIQFSKPKTGSEGIIGMIGYAKTDIKPEGEVFVKGERWQAISYKNQQINKEDKIEVVGIKNLKLIVKKIK